MPCPRLKGLALAALFLGPLVASGMAADEPRFALELEAGPCGRPRTTSRSPTTNPAPDSPWRTWSGPDPGLSGRLYFTWNINPRHGLRLLLAPLCYTESGVLRRAPWISPARSFAAGVPTEATYQFNSWRLSYRYRFHGRRALAWWVGFTAKIRDAKIEPGAGETAQRRRPTSASCPCCTLPGTIGFAERWHLIATSTPWPAVPVGPSTSALKVGYDFDERWSVAAGYRTVEGGADVDDVYNFAWFNWAAASVVLRF